MVRSADKRGAALRPNPQGIARGQLCICRVCMPCGGAGGVVAVGCREEVQRPDHQEVQRLGSPRGRSCSTKIVLRLLTDLAFFLSPYQFQQVLKCLIKRSNGYKVVPVLPRNESPRFGCRIFTTKSLPAQVIFFDFTSLDSFIFPLHLPVRVPPGKFWLDWVQYLYRSRQGILEPLELGHLMSLDRFLDEKSQYCKRVFIRFRDKIMKGKLPCCLKQRGNGRPR